MEIDEKHYPFILEDFDIRTKSYFHLKFDIAFSLISSSEISYYTTIMSFYSKYGITDMKILSDSKYIPPS